MKLSEQLFSKNAVLIYFFGVIALLVLIFFLWQPYSRAPISNADDPRFSPYISEHTAGVISKNSTIRIQLTPETSTLQDIGKEDSRKLITLYPEVSGKTFWLDANTIEFIPDQPLKPSTHYSGSFSLGKI